MEADRISSLHDSILHQIFSFLPTKDVVKSSILAKRWQKLWTSLSYLHFGESGFTNEESFIDFVDNVLYYHDNSRIIRFQLRNRYAIASSCRTQAWISAAVRAGVQELEVSLPRKVIGRGLPSCLFTCNSLERLKLDIGYVFRFPDQFCFPKLKSMDMCDVIFATNFTHQLLNSPNLEELFLRGCKIEDNCSSPSSHTHDTAQDSISEHHRHSRCFSKLNKAIIGLSDHSGKGKSGICASELIRKLSNVENLCLHNSYIQLLQTESNLLKRLPTFRNLKHLELTLVDKDDNVGVVDGDVVIMAFLLRCSPVLQSLDITFYKFNFPFFSGYCKRELKAEDFHTGELKWIKMQMFPGSKNQVELVKLFLANAKVLEKFIVCMNSSSEPSLREELLKFPRLSTGCELILYLF